jgi:hypothetical protein
MIKAADEIFFGRGKMIGFYIFEGLSKLIKSLFF